MEESRARDLWASFQHDPRDPAVAPLRASDADRDVVHGVLAEAFADGRLDREEYDERSAAVLGARTLGELPPLVADLVPDRPLVRPRAVPLVAAATVRHPAARRGAVARRRRTRSWASSARRCSTWAIWLAVAWGDWNVFPWPLIVNAVAFMNLVRVAANRRDLVADEVRRLERKQAKAIAVAEEEAVRRVTPRLAGGARAIPPAYCCSGSCWWCWPTRSSTPRPPAAPSSASPRWRSSSPPLRRSGGPPRSRWVAPAPRRAGDGVRGPRGGRARHRLDRAHLRGLPRAVLLLRLLRDDPLPLPRRPGHPRRAVRDRRGVHGGRLGLRLRLRRRPGPLARLVRRRRRRGDQEWFEPAVPVLHHPHQRRPLRRAPRRRTTPARW